MSLVAEADIDPAEGLAVIEALGWWYGHDADDVGRKDRARRLAAWPACLVVGMTSVAATEFEEGTYYPKLWNVAGFSGDGNDGTAWGQEFLEALHELGLRTFRFPEGSTHRYLSQILMHCGLPTYCLADLLRMLVEHSQRNPGLDADSFVLWLTGGPNRMHTLDQPVQRLINHGGEYAYDIIGWLLYLLDRLHDQRSQRDLGSVGLPGRLVAEACSLADRGELGIVPGAGRSPRRTSLGEPRLTIDPFGEGPRLLLPRGDATWRVVVDGQPHDIRAAPAWRDEDGDEPSFPLSSPARTVQVTAAGGTQATELTVVRDEDPMLVFTEDGEHIPASRPLPPDVVWVLFPAGRRLARHDELRTVSEALLPFGWRGWTLLEVDLAGERSLGLAGGDVRAVRGGNQPRLILSPPLPGVTAAHRHPVYAAPPLIALPEDRPRKWHIEVLPIDEQGTGQPVRLSERSGEVDPWNSMPRPLIATFDITVTGPLGFRLYRRVTVAEGLEVGYSPMIRLLTRDGLDPATVTLAGTAPLSPARLSYGPRQTELPVTYRSLRLTVTPPHLAVLHDGPAGGARWSAAPLRLPAEDFRQDDPGTLVMRVPDGLRLRSLLVAGGEVTHDVRPREDQPAGLVRYPLKQIRETAEQVHHLSLSLQVLDRVVPVAAIGPQVLAKGADLDGSWIVLQECREPGLHIGVYPVYAPWQGATVLPVRDNRARLPSRLRGIGPLRVLPAMRDARASWPYWPGEGDAFLVDAAASSIDVHSAFVAGSGPCPGDFDEERMWLAWALAGRLQADGARADLRAQLGMRMRTYPVASLLALAQTRLAPAEAVPEIIDVGLACQPLATRLNLAQARYLWGRLPVVAALLGGGALGDPDQLLDLIDIVAEQRGNADADLLDGEADPFPVPLGLADGALIAAEIEAGGDLGQELAKVATQADAVLRQTPYVGLASRIAARPDGVVRASAALALAMRADACSGGRQRAFRNEHRSAWADLARAAPNLVSLDIIAAQAAIGAIDRHMRTGK